jgi:hypothetical protein
MAVSEPKKTARKWPFRDAQPKRRDESDAFVEMWKREWLAGADACWKTQSLANPHAEDPERAAWQAGSDWAKDHPDRRKTHHLRLAHPNRRSTDPGRRVPRAVKIGAVGIGLLAASRWVWRALRPHQGGAANADPVNPAAEHATTVVNHEASLK